MPLIVAMPSHKYRMRNSAGVMRSRNLPARGGDGSVTLTRGCFAGVILLSAVSGAFLYASMGPAFTTQTALSSGGLAPPSPDLDSAGAGRPDPSGPGTLPTREHSASTRPTLSSVASSSAPISIVASSVFPEVSATPSSSLEVSATPTPSLEVSTSPSTSPEVSPTPSPEAIPDPVCRVPNVPCYIPSRAEVVLPNPFATNASFVGSVFPRALPVLDLSDASAWVTPALVDHAVSAASCHTSVYRWAIPWTECIAAVLDYPSCVMGVGKNAPLPRLSIVSGSAVYNVTTCGVPTFSAAETREAQAWIHAAQHPPDCNTALLSVSSMLTGGFGSVIHGLANEFMLAHARGHVWTQPVGRWDAGNCSTKDWACYFAPISNCTPPGVDGKRVHASSANNGPLGNRIIVVPARWVHKGFHWWRAQVIAYLLRPAPQTTAALVAAATRAFPGGLSRPLASVYIRHGDKGRESTVFRGGVYVDLLRPAILRGVRDVFLSSDTQDVLEEAVNISVAAGLTPHIIPRNRGSSLNGGPLDTFTGDVVLDLLLDLYLLAAADIAVGMSTSNWCRLADELRLVLGHGAQLLPYLDPWGAPFVEW